MACRFHFIFYVESLFAKPGTASTRAQLNQFELIFWHPSFTFNSNKSPNWCNCFSVYYPDFVYSLTCFGRFSAHHQSSMTAVAASGFTFVSWWQLCCVVLCCVVLCCVVLCCVVLCCVVLCCVVFVVRPAGPTTNTAQLSTWYEGKTRGCYCSHFPTSVMWDVDISVELKRPDLEVKQ
jgi:hypothetical protein